MKHFFLLICFGAIIYFFDSCKKENNEGAFNYEQAAGMWVPYEVTEFGVTQSVSQTTTGLFGSYSASVQLNNDQTFIPVIWVDKDNFTLVTAEAGTFEYIPSNKLKFEGVFEFECDISKFEGDYLWLQMHYTTGEVLWKFKRQL